MSAEAIEWLERDYDQMLPFAMHRPMGDGLVGVRVHGWQVGANVVRPMFEVINDLAGAR